MNMKTKKQKHTCVQCHKELTKIVNEPKMTNDIFVCDNPGCPNYGLLAICEENMVKAK